MRAIDESVPPAIRAGDPTHARRARILVGFAAILVVLGLETSFFFHYALGGDASVRVDWAMLVALSTTYLSMSALRRTGSVALAANVLLTGAFLVIVAAISVSGGIASPLLHWLALVPILAVLLCGRRSALAWLGVFGLVFACLIGADVLELDVGSPLAMQHLEAWARWIQKITDVGSWIVMSLLVMFLYERMREEQTAVVAAKNRELENEIEQRTLAEQRTRYLAYFDELTALPNRSSFKQNLQHAMFLADREDRQLAVMLLDLDGFKAVNDTHGHGLGDELLVEAARRLRACVRLSDQVARTRQDAVSRLGGDEFTILLDGLNERRQAALVAARVLEAVREPILIGDQEIYISGSIGIALYPGPADSLDELLRCADMAMYRAKESGKNSFCFFEESMNQEIVQRTTLAMELRHALENDEFTLHYQPIVTAADGSIVGVEALLRWAHPDRGMLRPGDFIEVAEECGLIVPIGDWVVERACRQLADWAVSGFGIGRLGINVSAVQLRGTGLLDALSRALDRNALSSAQIDLEITENAMMLDESEAIRCLSALKDLGVHISLDDFGTGYSSLSYVKRFPVDALKIDRSFTADLEIDSGTRGIAGAIVAMGRHLDLGVVGEGVEKHSQAEIRASGILLQPPVGARAARRAGDGAAGTARLCRGGGCRGPATEGERLNGAPKDGQRSCARRSASAPRAEAWSPHPIRT